MYTLQNSNVGPTQIQIVKYLTNQPDWRGNGGVSTPGGSVERPIGRQMPRPASPYRRNNSLRLCSESYRKTGNSSTCAKHRSMKSKTRVQSLTAATCGNMQVQLCKPSSVLVDCKLGGKLTQCQSTKCVSSNVVVSTSLTTHTHTAREGDCCYQSQWQMVRLIGCSLAWWPLCQCASALFDACVFSKTVYGAVLMFS